MKIEEKIQTLKNLHFAEWLKTRSIVDNELCQKQPMFCICGRLATGFHEKTCKKYNKKVDIETMKKLSNLI